MKVRIKLFSIWITEVPNEKMDTIVQKKTNIRLRCIVFWLRLKSYKEKKQMCIIKFGFYTFLLLFSLAE